VIPESESQVGGFIGLYRQVNEQILTLLQNAATHSATAPKSSVEQQVGDFSLRRWTRSDSTHWVLRPCNLNSIASTP